MKLHRVDITLSTSLFVRADTAEGAVKKAQEIQGRVMVLDPTSELVFAGPLSSRKRPDVSVPPTVVCVAVGNEADMVHKD